MNHQVYKLVEHVRAKGGNVTREPGPVKGGKTVIAFVKDPDGYTFEIIQRESTPEPLCQVMLRVGDLERAVKFYEKVIQRLFIHFILKLSPFLLYEQVLKGVLGCKIFEALELCSNPHSLQKFYLIW